MKGVRLKSLGVALLGALAVFLASCGQQPPPQPQTGNLEVTVLRADNNQPIQGAMVAVAGPQSASGVTDSQGKYTFTGLSAGNYTVSATAPNYNPGSTTATVQAGQTARVTVRLQPASPPPPPGGGNGTGRVARLEIVKVEDASGLLPAQDEDNPVKQVKLYAAQTEEAVRVTVRALDASGNPVPNASVEASLDMGGLNGVNLFTGCGAVQTQSQQVGTTNAQGEVCFTLYATSVFAGLLDDNFLYNFNNPVKLTVGSNGQLAEAKFFFYNISHLYYVSGSDQRYAQARAGFDFNTISNAYSFDNPAQNDHAFSSAIRRKQPTSSLLPPNQVGYMVYTINDTSKVNWVRTNPLLGVNSCEQVTPDGKTCTDLDASGVILRPRTPNEGITPQDLPFGVKVTATLVVVAEYGGISYEFPLKSYSFTKRWGGTGVRITKSGPRVIGWAGSNLSPNDVTLAKQNSGYTPAYTYTITVENIGNDVAKNVVVTDILPAELGFKAAGVVQNGTCQVNTQPTYDPILHQVTWSWTTTPSLVSIPAGGKVELCIQLYARHKPGYAWMDNQGAGSGSRPDGRSDEGSYTFGQDHGLRPPIEPSNTLYRDPYRVVNVVEVRSEAPGEPGNFARQSADLEIWVVRPFLTLTKTALSPVVQVGQTARFALRARNVDRAAFDPDYAFLKSQFPGDYANALTAYNVKVRDLFGRYLDFVNSTSDSGPGTLDALTRTVNFAIGNLGLGAAWNALLDFRVSGSLNNQFEDELALTNCARLYANNLNQYVYEWGPVKDPIQPEPYGEEVAEEPEPYDGEVIEDVVDPRPTPFYTLELTNPDTQGNFLQACASVQDADLTITNLGEFSLTGSLPTSVFVYGDGGVGPFTQVDTVGAPVRVGDFFYYIYLITNQGTVTVNDIDFRIQRLAGNAVELRLSDPGGFAVYRGTGTGSYIRDVDFTLTASLPTTGRIQSTVNFDDLDPGESLVVVVKAYALTTGQVTFQAWAQSTDPISIQTRFVQDNTNVQAP